jgi:hypothetical protein
MKTTNGTARSGLAEAGGTIELKDGKISIAKQVDSVNGDKKANALGIKPDDNTIAIFHTHGNAVFLGGLSVPVISTVSFVIVRPFSRNHCSASIRTVISSLPEFCTKPDSGDPL